MVTTLGVLAIELPHARGDDRVFCEVTPCLHPIGLVRHKLAAEAVHHGVTCKAGQEIGSDRDHRIVFCTTARAAEVDGLPIAGNSYTLFHPNGRIYQTHLGRNYTGKLGRDRVVTCGPDTIALFESGNVMFCKLAKFDDGGPLVPRVGLSIAFHPNGRIHHAVLDRAFTIDSLTMPAGATASFDDLGQFVGGFLHDPVTVGALTIVGDLTVYPGRSLKLHDLELAKPVVINGQQFPERAKLTFRDDGTLERARYVADRGFMIHGEQWTLTRTTTFDRNGKVLSSTDQRWQSRTPEKFSPRRR